MTSSSDYSQAAERVHSQLEETVAERYRAQGFTVLVEPPSELLPFDLGTYKPDLIATKSPTDGLIIEVKASAKRLSVDRYREIAEIVSQNPGWRFLLVTGDDSIAEPANKTSNLLSWEQIQSRVDQARRLINSGELEPAFLYLWTVLEAALRRRALQTSIPVERLTSKAMIDHLYSQGELSRVQFHHAKDLQEIRNTTVHGFEVSNLDEATRKLYDLITEILEEWT